MGPSDNVIAFDLTFSDDLVFGDADDTVVSATSAACCDTVEVDIPGRVSKRYVRWDVTAVGGETDNHGAADFSFQTLPPTVVEIPTMSAAGYLVLTLLLGATALIAMQRGSR